MSSNATPTDITATREVVHDSDSQPGPSDGPALVNPATANAQGVSQADYQGDGEKKAMEIHDLHALIQKERKAHIEETKRQEAEYQAQREEKERLEKAAQAQKDMEQKARIQRAIQATPEEREAYNTSLDDMEDEKRRDRYRANMLGRINGYLEAAGKKPRR
ncbi:hypothetical protein CFIO01_07383 [Colletotrichum fioriniae PJ7]|uniref:Uncharacterized protein n=1 Tax=Colletotrichum fioriniae PJ7 TaxID=1445577 RepID=A0A010QAJ3_9PEZI|nr:hypothetical protein CFIO01_07383 [Colletotrichum fioriniae PJ7]